MNDTAPYLSVESGMYGYYVTVMAWDDDFQCHMPTGNAQPGTYYKTREAARKAMNIMDPDEMF